MKSHPNLILAWLWILPGFVCGMVKFIFAPTLAPWLHEPGEHCGQMPTAAV